MRLKPAGKILIFMIVVIPAAIYWYTHRGAPNGAASTNSNGAVAGSTVNGKINYGLGRPLRVGIVTWPGYAGGIVANNGFKPNTDCIYYTKHGLQVEFMLMEDVDARAKAFQHGGADGVDIVWSTVDFWANELPGFVKNGYKARAIMQVDWSRGGDALVADRKIQRIEDLAGKRVSLALYTPSHWLLEYSLQNSSLDETAQSQIAKSIVGVNASPDAAKNFIAGKVDAAVVWEPDVTDSLRKRPGSHIVASSKEAANLIADLMVAREDFIKENPEVIRHFVEGWFDGTEAANRDPGLAAKLLMENEPTYKDLGEQVTRDQLSTVKWADLADNTKMFGLDGSEPFFDRVFKQASATWVKRGIISRPVSPNDAKDDRVLRTLYAAIPKDVAPKSADTEIKVPKADTVSPPKRVIMTKPVNIHFDTGQVGLTRDGKQLLDQVATLAQTYSNTYIRVEGNTDNVGSVSSNIALSERRAQTVVDFLVIRYKISRDRLRATGNGPNKPKSSNASAEGRAQNRRTDVIVVAPN